MIRLSIRKKLLGGFFAVILVLLANVVISYSQISKVDQAYSNLIDDRVDRLIQVKNMSINLKKEQLSQRSYLLIGDDASLQNFNTAHDQYVKLSKQLANETTKNELKDVISKLDQLENEHYQFTLQVIQLKNQNKADEAVRLISTQGRDISKRFNEQSDQLESLQQQLLDSGNEETSITVGNIKRLIVFIGIAGVIIGIGVALLIGRLISKPVMFISNSAKKIASGDLTSKEILIKNRDEIGELAASFNTMSGNIREIILQMGTNAEQIAASSEELTASAEQTAKATEQIANTMQTVATGVETQTQSVSMVYQTVNEMSIGFEQIADNTQKAASKAFEASEKASEGNKTIQIVMSQMNSIDHTVKGLAEIIELLGDQSKEISQIINVITDLSAQTNLLSLNAAIEAARAGEHGRGFEVVSKEVRKLSLQSAESAQQISAIISMIQQGMNNAVRSMGAVNKEVSAGMNVVGLAGKSFEQIQGAVGAVSSQTQEVSASVEQLTASVMEITDSIKIIMEVTEESAAGTQEVSAATEEQLASMEEIASASNELARLAEDLQISISRFKVI